VPGIDHESLVELFRNRPLLAVELIRDALGIAIPHFDSIAADSVEFNQIQPAEYRCDHVAVLRVRKKAVLGIIVEIQRSKDEEKLFSLPVYAADLRRRLRCPVVVLVFATTEAVARWAAKPVELGGPSVFGALVVGPSGVPVVTEVEAAQRSPELAVLSAVAHGAHDPEVAVKVATVASEAIEALDADRRALYSDMMWAALSAAARKALEMIPQGYQWQSEPMQTAARNAHLETKVKDVLTVLEVRSFTIDDELRRRVERCDDLETLERWHRQAILAKSIEEALS
jgi:hypothetical protein